PARPRYRPPAAAATTPPWPSGLPPATASAGSVPGGAPFFGHPLQAGRYRRQPLVHLQPRGLQRRATVVGDGTAHRVTVTPDRLGFGISTLLHLTLEGPDATDPLFQFLLCMAIGFMGRSSRLTPVVGLAELVRPPP